MRHFDAWILRDPYSIWHYYSTGRRWQETVRDMIHDRRICAPQVPLDRDTTIANAKTAIDPFARDICPQNDCHFLQKLPAEIRLMIYGYVFGDEAVHLVQLKGKIRHVRCKDPSSSIETHRHCCPETPARWRVYDGRVSGHSDRMLYPHTHTRLPEMLSNSSLSLLRTCRMIYLEAADIPYSNLVFDVDDLHTFVAFSLSVCPEIALSSIKRLTVQWMPVWQPMAGEEHWSSIYSHTHNDRLWAQFWARVEALSGLEELQVSLDLGRFTGSAVGGIIIGGKRIRLAIDEAWVAPMLAVRGLKKFDLCVTAKCDASAKNLLGEEMQRDAALLCDQLRMVMCSPRGTIPTIPELRLKMEDMNDMKQPELRLRPRLAITAA